MSTFKINPLYAAGNGAMSYPALTNNTHLGEMDVVVVGAGFTGLTAATELIAAGKRVAVIDKGAVGGGESNLSTAQLTQLLDMRYRDIISKFGADGATKVAQSSRDAIDWVERQVRAGITCGFKRVPAFLFSENTKSEQELDVECLAAIKAGVDAQRVTESTFPIKFSSALRTPNQAQLNPRLYLQGLAERFVNRGGLIFENTRVETINDGTPCVVVTENAVITARDVIVATHTPICNILFLHTKLAAYRTYVVGARLESESFEDGLFFDMTDPYHYIRKDRDAAGNVTLLVGGEDHKTGENEAAADSFRRLEEYTTKRFGVSEFTHHWSGQVIKSIDGLPYIGKNSMSEHLYVGTGYNGNGTTFGTLAGIIICDQILGRKNPYADLYMATRISPLAGMKEFVTENTDVVAHFIGDRLKDEQCKSIDAVPRGEGRIVSLNGKNFAVYHGNDGHIHALSPKCTHVGCTVQWNNSEKTWDCPCHGARYDTEGKVLNGPAVSDLERAELPLI